MNQVRIDEDDGKIFASYSASVTSFQVLPVCCEYSQPEPPPAFPTSVISLEIVFNGFYYHSHTARRNEYFISSPTSI